MTDAEIVELNNWWRRYLVAGRAIFTTPSLVQPTRHRTYRVITRPDQKRRGWIHFVSAKMTNREETKWEYVGLYDPERGEVRRTGKSAFDAGSDIYETINFVACALRQAVPVTITPSGQCSVCGRPLEDPASVLIGIGPTCRQALGFDARRLTRFLGQDAGGGMGV